MCQLRKVEPVLTRMGRVRAPLVAAIVLSAFAFSGHAQATILTGIDGGGLFTDGDQTQRDRWFDTTVDLNAGIARLDLNWSSVASSTPANAADPADPAYDFSAFDQAVRDATARDLRVMITFFGAPDYAQAGGEPASAEAGAWKPHPAALGAFATAVASRYSGSFGGLPRVRHYEVWNEPNLDTYLAPQYAGGKSVAVDRYRQMVNAVQQAVSSVRSDNVVIGGSLAPYGDPPGGPRTRPLVFLRKFFCLNHKLESTGCPNKPRIDVLSHHPINLSGGPRTSAIDPDDVSSPDLENVRRVLRAAERAGTIAGTRRRHPLWVTEYWWESFPDGPYPGIPGLRKHGRWIEEALYLFWKAGAKVAIYYTLMDSPFDPQQPYTLQAGLFRDNGTPKPAATAFRFPFVTERKSGGQVRAWGKAPATGTLRIERQTKHGWRRIDSETVTAGQVFTSSLALRGKANLRASVGGQQSLVWTQRKD